MREERGKNDHRKKSSGRGKKPLKNQMREDRGKNDHRRKKVCRKRKKNV